MAKSINYLAIPTQNIRVSKDFAGGIINKDTFDFLSGKCFYFLKTSGNEFTVVI